KKERPRSAASVNLYLYLQDLRSAYNLAKRNGKVDKNPVADVRLLHENNKRERETSYEETTILTALDPSERRFHTDLRPMPFARGNGPAIRGSL
ncbi:MAG TPA: hypothetical protein VMD08_10005, partial [Candidatus Baltobacteraceae bacterium]|nr:hypothetical protein [Candidatus Baltobacteraceae bacterium]